MMDEDFSTSNNNPNIISRYWKKFSQLYQLLLDSWTPYTLTRWIFALILIAVYAVRTIVLQGWYIITYALGIYYLNLFIAFLTPKIDPAMDFDNNDDGLELPTKANEEFRPFIRRLPEFKFWYSVCQSTLVALICTFFDCLNVPVFWPILVLYFFTLFFITMRRQIQHMIKYKYIPFTHGKPKYSQMHNGDIKLQGSK